MSSQTGLRDADTSNESVLRTVELKKYYETNAGFVSSLFGAGERYVRAVDGVSLSLEANETIGLVGESGCGKSTLARTLVRLEEPTGGRIYLGTEDITETRERALRLYRGDIQFIHQDPSSSLNPRKRVQQILSRPLELHTDFDKEQRTNRIAELLSQVGLDPTQRSRYPHELSGGQRQRIEIARALSVDPSVVIADEPTSALDVTVQAQILERIEELQDEFNLSLLFISHDLRTIRYIADTVAVMYLGKIVESGPTERVFENPKHPYTQSLLSSVPSIGETTRERLTLSGEPPNPVDPPSGCRFHTRCPVATPACGTAEPVETMATEEHMHRCHFSNADIAAGVATNPVPDAPEAVEEETND